MNDTTDGILLQRIDRSYNTWKVDTTDGCLPRKGGWLMQWLNAFYNGWMVDTTDG
jgi:hypothetical protein